MSKKTWEKLWKKQAENRSLFQKLVWALRHNTSRKYAEIMGKLLGKNHNPKILEVGCGSAVTFQYLGKTIPGAKLTGLDYSPEALKIAKRQNPNARFFEGDARKLPFRRGEFDLVYSLGLIEHFPRQEALKIMKEHVRVTKSGGTVFVVVPEKYSALNLARIIAGKRWHAGFEDPFSREEFRKLLSATGLLDIKISRLKTIILLGIGRKG